MSYAVWGDGHEDRDEGTELVGFPFGKRIVASLGRTWASCHREGLQKGQGKQNTRGKDDTVTKQFQDYFPGDRKLRQMLGQMTGC
jgi:hypothetical protein